MRSDKLPKDAAPVVQAMKNLIGILALGALGFLVVSHYATDNTFGALATLIQVILFLFLPLTAYLTPTIIAGMRRHRNLLSIFVLNFCLGWTLLGWVISLVWACMATERKMPVAFNDNVTVLRRVS